MKSKRAIPAQVQPVVMSRGPLQTPKTIRVKWGQMASYSKPDLCVSWGEGCEKADARLVVSTLDELSNELRRRGYDISTMRFQVKKHNTKLSRRLPWME